MSHFNTKIGKDIISVDEMLSKYLWNQTRQRSIYKKI